MFGFVFQMSSLIVEKELKLREAMTMMGLYDTAYWLSWLSWEGIMTILSSLFIVLFGMMFMFDFFLHNNFLVLYLVFFLFQLNMVGFAFMLSAFVSKASSSTTVGFTKFILGFLSQLVTTAGFPYGSGFSKTSRFIWSLFPPNLLAKALKILADATSTPQDRGISLSGITECGPNHFDCVITLLDGSTPDDVDVLEEENVVKQEARDGTVLPNIAVQIHGLVRTYPGTRKGGCCCGKKNAPYHAVKGLWVNFAKDQLFCLLGPNGAGKTTTISCLTALAPVTGGDALIYGHSARSSVGMANIRKIIGVCPQFDILWSAFTGQEHLHLFATIKGLPPSSIEPVAENSLAEVRLDEAARMRAGSYSGGMKRA